MELRFSGHATKKTTTKGQTRYVPGKESTRSSIFVFEAIGIAAIPVFAYDLRLLLLRATTNVEIGHGMMRMIDAWHFGNMLLLVVVLLWWWWMMVLLHGIAHDGGYSKSFMCRVLGLL